MHIFSHSLATFMWSCPLLLLLRWCNLSNLIDNLRQCLHTHTHTHGHTHKGTDAIPFSCRSLASSSHACVQVDEDTLDAEALKERRIMKLLLKIKNGTPPMRKVQAFFESHTHTHTHTHTHSLSLALSLSHTHTHTNTLLLALLPSVNRRTHCVRSRTRRGRLVRDLCSTRFCRFSCRHRSRTRRGTCLSR